MAKSSAQAGFTLVELLVVVTLTVMLMLSASAIMMTFLIGSAKTSSISRVKQEGDYAAAQMELAIRNAVEILPNSAGQTCVANMGELKLKNYDNSTTQFNRGGGGTDADPGRIVLDLSTYLTSPAVNLITPAAAGLPNNPNFSCQTSADGFSNYITVTFVLRKGTPGVDQARDIVEQKFTFGSNIRSK